MVATRRSGADRILTAPNAISCSRLLLLAAFIAALAADARVLAFALLAVAGVTDFLDGYVARRFNQVSTIGKVLDPMIDRLVLITAVVAMVVYGAIPPWLAALVLFREVLVSGTVLVLAALGARRFDVSWIGKAGTFGLMVSLPCLLLGDGPGTIAQVFRFLGWLFVVPSLCLSFVAAIGYLPLARAALGARHTSLVAPERSA